MSMRFTELQCKEVICIGSGQRLGFVTDVVVEVPSGQVCAIVVPGAGRGLGFPARREEYVIPWSCIKMVGPDIVLVETKPGECRVARGKPGNEH